MIQRQRIRNSIGLLAVLVLGLIITSGCMTAGRVLVTSTKTVDAAMTSWTRYAEITNAPREQRDAVKKLYQDWQAAELVGEKAYIASLDGTNKTSWERAAAAMKAIEVDLLQLINRYKTNP